MDNDTNTPMLRFVVARCIALLVVAMVMEGDEPFSNISMTNEGLSKEIVMRRPNLWVKPDRC